MLEVILLHLNSSLSTGGSKFQCKKSSKEVCGKMRYFEDFEHIELVEVQANYLEHGVDLNLSCIFIVQIRFYS